MDPHIRRLILSQEYDKVLDIVSEYDGKDKDKALEILDELYDEVIETEGALSEKAAEVLEMISDVYASSGDLEKALPINNSLYELFNTIEENSEQALETKLDIAYTYMLIGRNEEAYDICRSVLEIALDKYGVEYGVTRNAISYLADCCTELEMYDEALSYLEALINIVEENGEMNQAAVALVYDRIGNVYRHKKSYDKSLENLNKGFSIVNGMPEKYANEKLAIMNSIGNLYSEMGMLDEAEKMHSETLDKAIVHFGYEHANVNVSRMQLAEVYTKRGEYDKAEDLLTKVYDSLKQVYGEDYHLTKEARIQLFELQQQKGQKYETM